MNLSPFLSICCIVFAASVSWAQPASLVGKVADATDGIGLPGAHISLKGPQEIAGISGDNGLFRIQGIPAGEYRMTITFLGYDTLQSDISLKPGESNWLGTLEMTSASTLLDEVEIRGKQVLATQKGDTTAFNADAFKTNPDASAEDLARKMPGIVVSGSGVQAQGEQVQEILVDGKPFFGNDPSAALKNLPAEIVSQIQVFDRLSDEDQASGFNSGETIKTMNIVLRPGMSNGTFGNVTGGYGYEDVYRASASVNLFNEEQRISVLGQSNNINQQNFSSEDLVGVSSGSGGRGRRRGGGGDSGNFLVGQQDGITTTHAAGLNYSDEWGDNLEITGSYFFNNNRNTADQSVRQSFFSQENVNQVYEETNDTESNNFNHRANLRLDWDLSDRTSLIWRPRFSAQSNDGQELTEGQTIAGNTQLNQTRYVNSSLLQALDFSSDLIFRQRFAKRGRSLTLSMENSYNQNNGEGFLLSEISSIQDPEEADTLDQQSDLAGNGWGIEGDFRYSEPIGRKGQFQLRYEVGHQQDDSDRRTNNFLESTGEYDELVPGLSNVFNSSYTRHEPGIGYRFNDRKFMFNLRAEVQWATLNSTQEFPEALSIDRQFFAVIPSLFARIRFSNSKQLRFGYRARTQAPSISQLQNVVDNSNPLQLRTGNAALDQNYTHTLFVRYNLTNTEKATVLYLLGNIAYTSNYIANSTVFSRQDTVINGVTIPAGGQLTIPVNLDGFWNGRFFVTYGLPLTFIKSNLNINAGITYRRQPGQIDLALNFANSTDLNLGLTLSSNINENLDFTIGTTSAIGLVRNSLQSQQDNRYLNQRSEASLVWTFGPGIVFRTDLTHQLYTGLSEGFNQNFALWNASIGKKFFKNDQGELTFQVFDILGQNTSVSRNVTETFIEDVTTQVLQRYFMLSFRYNIRKFTGIRQKGLEEQQNRFR